MTVAQGSCIGARFSGSRSGNGAEANNIKLTDMNVPQLTLDGNLNGFIMEGGEVGNYNANDCDPQIGQHSSAANYFSPKNMVIDGVWFHDVLTASSNSHTECLQVFGYDGLIIRNSKFGPNCGQWTGGGSTTVVTGLRFAGAAQPDEVRRNVLVENNFFGAVPRSGYTAQFSGNGTVTNFVVRNNTFAEDVFFDLSPANQFFVQNNILHAATTVQGASQCGLHGTFSHNHFFIPNAACGDSNATTGAISYVGFNNVDLRLSNGGNAVDTGNNATCAATDIDGHARPVNGVCDRGAFEHTGEITETLPAPPGNLRRVN
jgi:hypothetical protein